jgi:hypothetical protein
VNLTDPFTSKADNQRSSTPHHCPPPRPPHRRQPQPHCLHPYFFNLELRRDLEKLTEQSDLHLVASLTMPPPPVRITASPSPRCSVMPQPSPPCPADSSRVIGAWGEVCLPHWPSVNYRWVHHHADRVRGNRARGTRKTWADMAGLPSWAGLTHRGRHGLLACRVLRAGRSRGPRPWAGISPPAGLDFQFPLNFVY